MHRDGECDVEAVTAESSRLFSHSEHLFDVRVGVDGLLVLRDLPANGEHRVGKFFRALFDELVRVKEHLVRELCARQIRVSIALD